MGSAVVSDKEVKRPADDAIESARDVPRIDASSGLLSGRKVPYSPLIVETRNDDNLILSQQQCALMQVRDRLVDLQMARHERPAAAALNLGGLRACDPLWRRR